MLKYSRQRECIKDYLYSSTEHPTADMIYAHIKTIYPNVSLGTVYRNLSLLVSIGEIQKLCCGNGVDHFDANTKPHYHFICRECGCIRDVPMTPLTDIDRLANSLFVGDVDSHTIYFHGICADCKEKTKKC